MTLNLVPRPGYIDAQRASEIEERSIAYFWFNRVPLGKITMVDGDPGVGKSHLFNDLVSRATRGENMPDGTPGMQGGVIMISVEEDPEDTLRPRLRIAGADLERVTILTTYKTEVGGKVNKHGFMLPRDIDILEYEIERNNAILVTLDPLMAVIQAKHNSISDQAMREVLAPLSELAARKRVAVTIARHLNKSTFNKAILPSLSENVKDLMKLNIHLNKRLVVYRNGYNSLRTTFNEAMLCSCHMFNEAMLHCTS